VLLRLVNMRGVNLNVFDFDYDLTWAAFFMNGNEKVYGRYGGRDAGPAEAHLSLAGLKYAMRQALAAHQRDPNAKPGDAKPAFTAEQYPAATRRKNDECIHCHMVYDFRRDALKAEGRWTRDHIWVYPPPANLGLILEVDEGNRLREVVAGSTAQLAGLRPGDLIKTVAGRPVASYGDISYGLNNAPQSGKLSVGYQRDGRTAAAAIELADGWRESDISWRASMWGLEPAASVWGKDLTAAQKERLGLGPNRLAFRQGDFVPPPARQAGIRAKDVIIGIDEKELEMNMLQFNVYVRLNYQVGDRVTYNVIRDGKRLDVPMVLAARD
jgi:hypothetical protein